MKISRVLLFLFLAYASQIFSFDQNILIEAINNQNISKILDFFEQIEEITLEEAQEITNNLYDHYVNIFGPQLLGDEYIENLERCKTIYHFLLENSGVSAENSLIKMDSSFNEFFCYVEKKRKRYLQLLKYRDL